MSTLIVNKLKNSSGGAPTLTWPTADGTNGQAIKSDDNAGKLSFATPSLLGGTTKLTFPDSATNGDNLQTDGAGNVSAVSFTNPMKQGSHDGMVLLDRYVLSGTSSDADASSITMSVPSAYTSQEYNTITGMILKIRYLGVAVYSSSWNPRITLQRSFGNAGNYIAGMATSQYQYRMKYGPDGFANQQGSNTVTTSTGRHQVTNDSMSSAGSASAAYQGDRFIAGAPTNNDDTYRGNNSLWSCDYMLHCATIPTAFVRNWYHYNANNSNISFEYYTQTFPIDNLSGHGSATSTTRGQHPGGFLIQNNQSSNFNTGFIELYGIFKDGVV